MAEIVNMPKLGFDMQEGQLVRWLKKPGDPVKVGEPLAEIESDKATIEVEAYVEGTLLQHLVNENDWVPIGAPIAVIGQAGETVDPAALGVVQPAAEKGAEAAPSTPQQKPASPAPVAAPKSGNGDGLPDGVRASPLARKIADEQGVSLSRIRGSGPGGRIVKADVEAHQEGSMGAPAKTAPAYAPVQAGAEDETIPTPRIRSRIAARMIESKATVPHFYVTTEIDMGAALDLRKDLNARRADDDRLSVNDLIVKATALAAREFPNLNSSYNGDTIIRHGRINVGIAVALDEGLINVVSRDADITPLTVMARSHREMIARAREGKVKPEDVEGETFAVSNLGVYDVEHFVAIINPPAAAILAIGSARQVPIVKEDGTLGVGRRMKATISADHRVTDGAEAARFMQRLKEILEDPLRLLM
ncbi:MAG: 2-oxo acid dehydrogenase subunit E2 [Anaerolineae bacterium]|nr:2-oxo acid dehydrogenase subunit E2 [Anaerolineae bacterium]